MQEVALAEAARHAAEALPVDLDIGAHADQCIGEAEAVLVHGLVDDRDALGLGQGDDEGLLPVRHEAGVDVRFEDQRVELAAAVVEADAVVADVHAAADLAVGVQEGHHVALGGAFNEDVAAGDQGRGSPGGRLVAVREGAVVVAAEVPDAFDPDGAVRLDADDGAHLLQHRDEVHDFRLGGRPGEFGDAFGARGAQQDLLGGADGRVGQRNLGALEPVGRGDVDAAGALFHDGAELAQDIQVVVDRAVADLAAAQVRDEGLADGVDQRPAQQDRDARIAGVGVDGRAGRGLGILRVKRQVAGDGVLVDPDAVELEQAGDNLDVLDFRDVAQHGWLVAQKGSNHGLGDKILGPANGDAAS